MTRAAGLITDGFVDAARAWPDKVALICADQTLTYGDLAHRVARVAARIDELAARRVAIARANDAAVIELFLGVTMAGAMAMMFEPQWPRATSERMRAAHAPHLVFDDSNASDYAVWRDAGDPARALLSQPTPDMPFLIGFTSGTTGTPKAFIRSHASWVASFAASAHELGTSATTTALIPGPLSHGLSLYAAIEVLNAGGTVVLMPAFDAQQAVGLVAAQGANTIVSAPTVLDLIAEQARVLKTENPPHPASGRLGEASPTLRIPLPRSGGEENKGATVNKNFPLHPFMGGEGRVRGVEPHAPRAHLDLVRTIITAGAKLSPQIRIKLASAFPKADVVEYYGASELSFVTVAKTGENCPPTSVGRAFTGVEIAVRRDDGTPAPEGEIGTVWVKSNMVSSGYVGIADGAGFRSHDGWATVGDRGALDARGFLTLAGRAGDMIITGGYNVYPSEVETALALMPGVREAAVVGVADARWGQVVTAIIAGDAAVSADAIKSHCVGHLPPYKVPRRFFRIAEFEHTISGKIDRAKLLAALDRSALEPLP